MSHKRTEIRNYLKELLLGKTSAGNKVYKSRITPFKEGLPAINVFSMTERPGEIISRSPLSRWIILDISIEITLAAKEGYDDALDALCKEVEDLIPFDLGGLVKECLYAGTDTFFDVENQQPVAVAKMKYEGTYQWTEGAMVTEDDLAELDKVYIQWDFYDLTYTGEPGPDEQIDAEDHIEGIFN